MSRQLKAKEVAGRTVVLKLKTSDFGLLTRNRQLDSATQLADRLYRTGADLLRREADGRRFRLIGIGVSDLVDPCHADPPDLVDTRNDRMAKAERAMDAIRARYGDTSVRVGSTTTSRERPRDHPYG